MKSVMSVINVKFNTNQMMKPKFKNENDFHAKLGMVTEITTSDHNKLTNKDLPNQHPIEAISGLAEALAANQDKSYVHIQSQAANVWHIQHDLKKMPSVVVKDSAGNTVVGESEYVDENNIILSFSGAFSGKAFLN